MSSDAYNPTVPLPDGSGAARCMRNALRDAQINPDQVGYVNAHGTATKIGDAAETRLSRRCSEPTPNTWPADPRSR